MKKHLLQLKTIAIAACLLISGAVNAFTAVTSGAWSSAATWGGTAPGPNVSGNDIIIPAGITVNLDMDVTFTGLLNNFNVSGSLTGASNGVTMVSGSLIGNGTLSIMRLQFNSVSTAAFSGTMNVARLVNSSLSLGLVAIANISDSLVLQAGSLMLNTNSNLTMLTGSTIRVNNGTIGIGGGLFSSGNNYNVVYVGTSKTSGIELAGNMLQNVTVNLNSNSETITLNGNTSVANNLNLMMGKLNLNGRKLTVSGDLMMSTGTAFISNSSSELEIAGSGTLTSGLGFDQGNATINNLTINRNNGTVRLYGALNIAGNLNLGNGNFSLESGSTLTMNSNSKIWIGGGMLAMNSGSFAASSNYDVEYTGASSYTAGIELNGTGLEDLTVNTSSSSATVMLTNSLAVSGALSMSNGHISMNGYNVFLNGTLSQSATAGFIGHAASELHLNLSTAANSTLYFDGGSASTQSLSRLRLNISGTSAIALGSALHLVNELSFVKGKVLLTSGDLVMESTSTISGFDDNRYVATSLNGTGRLQMNVTAGSAWVTFPVGTMDNYSPAFIQQTSSGTSGNFMVRTANEVMVNGTTGPVDNGSAMVGRTWFIESASTVSVNMNLKLGWVAAAEMNAFNRNNAMIRHYTNSAWDTYAAASATAGANSTWELSRSGIMSLSPFAVTDNSAPLAIQPNNNDLNFELYPVPAHDQITVRTKGGSETYKYELIDITGRLIATGEKGETQKFDIGQLQPGYYFIKVIDAANNASGIKRFVKN